MGFNLVDIEDLFVDLRMDAAIVPSILHKFASDLLNGGKITIGNMVMDFNGVDLRIKIYLDQEFNIFLIQTYKPKVFLRGLALLSEERTN